jgi:nucleoside-diphosphate-sugar epimerase
MQSDMEGPANIGSPEYVTVQELFDAVVDASGKSVTARYVDGPVGVQSRNFSHARIESLGWSAPTSLRTGIGHTYAWIADQVLQASQKVV